MSRRGVSLLIGGIILLLLVRDAGTVVVCGLAYTAWVVHRSSSETITADDAVRAAMIGGFFGRVLIGLLVLVGLPLFASGGSPGFVGNFLLYDAAQASSGFWRLGALALFHSCLLALAVRLISPSLPR